MAGRSQQSQSGLGVLGVQSPLSYNTRASLSKDPTISRSENGLG